MILMHRAKLYLLPVVSIVSVNYKTKNILLRHNIRLEVPNRFIASKYNTGILFCDAHFSYQAVGLATIALFAQVSIGISV